MTLFLALFPWILLIGFLIWASVVDYQWQLLPLEPLWLMMAFGLGWSIFFGNPSDAFFGALFWMLWTGGMWSLSRGRWMGFADIWLTGATGSVLGITRSIETWYFVYVVFGIMVLLYSLFKQRTVKGRIAFAPLLLGGVLLSFLSQGKLMAWFASVLQG